MKNYILKKIESNVTEFNSELNSYAYVKDGSNYLLFNDKTYHLRYTPMILTQKDRMLYIKYSDGICEKLSNGCFFPINDMNLEYVDFDEYYANVYIREEYKKKFNLLDLQTNQLILKKYVPYRLYTEENIIIAYDNFKGEFQRINTETEVIWQFPLSSLGGSEYEPDETDTMVKILGVAHGNLWIYTKFGRLVALDIDTGEFIKGFSGSPLEQYTFYENTAGLGDCFMRKLDKNIISISGIDFQTIDTQNMCVVEKYDLRLDSLGGMYSYEFIFSSLLQGDYFTFLGQKVGDYGGIGWVGIFDYKARKLVWEYEVITQEERDTTRNQLVAPQPLYMSGNKLYIKDIKDNLHIFEKE